MPGELQEDIGGHGPHIYILDLCNISVFNTLLSFCDTSM